ncbi:MAG: metal ABC transporter permease [Candidatus Sumerlaeia bacterium]|nr:metal ABC transporter permease [Candidatus Sumerlaeia bacterium]
MLPVAIVGGATGHANFWADLWRVLSLQDHNTRVVVIGTTLLGVAAGLVGTFLLLRRRSLLADAVSHATLPGICLAFLVMVLAGGTGKHLPLLLLGAGVTGALGMLTVVAIRRFTRLKDDAALGIVLSVFFGIGIALLGVVTRMQQGSAAGLQSFIYGKTASMLWRDALLIGGAAFGTIVLCVAFFKEFSLVCFDPGFAETQGWPVFRIDIALMTLVVVVTVIGLQAVGLILVVALLIIPPAAARFWTDRLGPMMTGSALLGGASGLVGSGASALLPDMPAGAVIVLVATGFFAASFLLGRARGVLPRAVRHARLTARIGRQNLLRALYESGEERDDHAAPVGLEALLARRSWSRRALRRLLAGAERDRLVERVSGAWRLTADGIAQARQVLRNHRLWEMYLITHADIAPSHVDRDADAIEHILDAGMILRLEELMAGEALRTVPASPHAEGT